MYQPKNLLRWRCGVGGTAFDGPHNYIGARFPEYYVAPCTTHRDADCLNRANWLAQARELDELVGLEYDDEGPTETNNWAVGWTSVYLIHEENEAALRKADELAECLNDYPVLDDELFSQLEWEAADDYWQYLNVRERAEYAERYAYEWRPMQLRHDTILALTDPGELATILAQ